MEGARRSKDASLQIWAFLAVLLTTQNLLLPVMSTAIVGDQKNYFHFSPPTDPNAGSPPTVVVSPPTGGGGGSYNTPPTQVTPPSGSGGGYGTTPSHGGGGTTPSHGGGSGHHGHSRTPPTTNCGTPPSRHHNPTHAPPTHSGGGGGYHNPPPTGGTPPSITPITPTTPTTPSITPTPTTPSITPTPTTPSITPTPTTPSITPTPTTPTTPGTPYFPYDPNSPPSGGTCDFWRNHPTLIWGLFGWWGTTVGGAFGVPSVPGYGSHLSLQQALSNARTDGLGALYREGTASLLNSMVNTKFPFTTNQVKNSFVASLVSNKAAGTQARVFKRANEAISKSRV